MTHFVFDPDSRELVVIDPRVDSIEDYREFISENGLTLSLVIDTGLHWHHLSGTHLLSKMYDTPIGMSDRTLSRRPTRKLSHGERIKLGRFEMQVLQTPGVGADAICLVLPGLVFSGDTLLIGEGARMDLPGGSAPDLWKSQREILGALSDECVVFPGCDLDDHLFSILSIERKSNPDFCEKTLADFVAAKQSERPRGEGDARKRMALNAEPNPALTHEGHFGGPVLGAGSKNDKQCYASIGVEKFFHKIREHADGNCFLDVREPGEFNAGHFPGAKNIPLSKLALHLGELSAYRRVYVSCQSGRRSLLAAKTLDYIGLRDVVDVAGGFSAWAQAGLPVAQD
jgi:glyoxylase-like metal-dependent hydrolase (beta-lactamase superfamily II)/rhodanese-related sulfurtransferase